MGVAPLPRKKETGKMPSEVDTSTLKKIIKKGEATDCSKKKQSSTRERKTEETKRKEAAKTKTSEKAFNLSRRERKLVAENYFQKFFRR
jgi:hypothetical protein